MADLQAVGTLGLSRKQQPGAMLAAHPETELSACGLNGLGNLERDGATSSGRERQWWADATMNGGHSVRWCAKPQPLGSGASLPGGRADEAKLSDNGSGKG